MMRERETFRGGPVVVVVAAAGMGVHGIEHFFVTRQFFFCFTGWWTTLMLT